MHLTFAKFVYAHAQRPPKIGIYFRPLLHTCFVDIIFKFNVIKRKKFSLPLQVVIRGGCCNYLKRNEKFPILFIHTHYILRTKNNTQTYINVSILLCIICKNFMTRRRKRRRLGGSVKYKNNSKRP